MQYNRVYLLKELLFQCIDPNIVAKFTGWEKGPYDEKNPTKSSLHMEKLKKIGDNTAHPDYHELKLIEYAYCIFNSQYDETLRLKVENLPSFSRNVFENTFPLNLSEKNCLDWARRSIWTDEEAVCLSIGLIPTDTVIRYIKCEEILPFASFTLGINFKDRLAKLSMAFNAGKFILSPTPIDYLDWFKKMRFTFPERLAQLTYVMQGDTESSTKTSKLEVSSTHLKPKKLSSLLTLIHAIGASRYVNYDINDTRNGAIKRIETLILDQGLKLSERTIRDTMKEAAEEAERLRDKNN